MMTRRSAVQAISIGLGLAAVSGVLGVLHASQPDYEALRAEFSREIDRVEALPPDDPVKKDRRIEELLVDGERQTHARALWLRLERLHGPVHRAAQADEAARKSVQPFLARCSTLAAKSPAELRSLDDEARSLLDEHGSTRFGIGLVEARRRLSRALEAGPPSCSETDHFRLLQDIQKDRISGRFADAMARLDDAVPKHSACEPFLVRLRSERGNLLSTSTRAAEALLEEARTNRGIGRKDEAARALERALPNFKGLPAEGRLRALLEELRRP